MNPKTMIAAVALLLAAAAASAAVAEDAAPAAPPPAPMTAEQAAIAARIEKFIAEREQWYFRRMAEINGSADIETRQFSYDTADHTVKVTRGPVLAKAAWYVDVPRKGIPPFVPALQYGRYVEVDMHPANPHAGFLHATLFVAVLPNGKSMMAGYMDYVPAVWHEEDNQQLKSAVDAVYAKHGVDITRFRRQLCDSAFGARHHRDRLKAACVGASLYDPPMMEVSEASFDLAIDAWQTFIDSYLAIVAKRSRDPVSEADLRAQDAMRRRWLEDQLFADTFTVKVVPYEVWSFADQAPTVRF